MFERPTSNDDAYQSLLQDLQKESDAAKKQELQKRLEQKQAEIQKMGEPLREELSRLSLVLRRAQPTQNAGYVFVFLRK